MKTAVEKIIAEIDKEVDWLKTHQYVTEVRGRMIGLAFAKRVALEAKEMEKEQIIKAFYSHVSAMSHDDLPAGEKYYKDTYNSSPSSEWDAVDKCPSCGSPCNIYSDLDENDNCNDCRN
jgi:hypothetical protein